MATEICSWEFTDIKDVEAPEPKHSMLDLPKIEVHVSKLRELTPRQRLHTVASQWYGSKASASAKAAAARMILTYLGGGIARTSPTMWTWYQALHKVINFFEIDATLQSSVNVVDDAARTISARNGFMHELTMQIIKQYKQSLLTDNVNIRMFNDRDDWCTEYPMQEIATALTELDPDIAAAHNYVSEHSEFYEEGTKSYSLHVFRIADIPWAFVFVRTGTGPWALLEGAVINPRGDYNESCRMLSELESMSKKNFIKIVNPQRNILELVEKNMRVRPRRVTYEASANIPYERIRTSMSEALRLHTRHVIALIGDAGLGKTQAVHALVNSFPDIPAFFVTPSALSGSLNGPKSVRSVFDACASVESVLVIDDFDGLDLKEKNETTTEFLLQLEGGGAWQGVALLIINDPSAINNTIMNRPGRIDEVWEIGYLTTPEQVLAVLKANFSDAEVEQESEALRYMIEHKFSIARIVASAKYAMLQTKSVTEESLLVGAKMQSEFETNAKKVIRDGRLADAKQTKGSKTIKTPEPVSRRKKIR